MDCKSQQINSDELAEQDKNEQKVEVVNTWLNRLPGDSRHPADKRPPWCPVNPYKTDDPLQTSGLFGPVNIVSFNYH